MTFSDHSIEEILADSEDEDEEEDDRSRGREQRKLARQRSQAWLKEGGGDEPLNFLDPKVAQRVLGKQGTDNLLWVWDRWRSIGEYQPYTAQHCDEGK